MKETDFHDWLKEYLPRARGALIGIGDDAAVLDTSSPIAVASDLLVEGIHFKMGEAGARQIGAKAVNRNFSDMAAMGLSPDWLLVSAAVPSLTPEAFVKDLVQGMREAADRFDAFIVGGDTSRSLHGLVIDVMVIAQVGALQPVSRSGARPGHCICVTGELGGSLLKKHLDFIPRVSEGLFLNRFHTPSAMLDISDGLLLDLSRLLDASHVGAELTGDRIPLSDDAHETARTSGLTPLTHALMDGEDFELLFTVDPDTAERLMRDPRKEFRITEIGVITPDPAQRIIKTKGRIRTFGREGYDHSI
ncbi:MAG: thiamine-phosphate kinase [Planctomycetota bacterium]